MAMSKEGSEIAMSSNDIAIRAGRALDALVDGPCRDKLVARKFNVSVRMAKYLRDGKCWTVERLSVASLLFGETFDQLLFPTIKRLVPEPPATLEIHERLDRLEKMIDELLKRGGTGVLNGLSASRAVDLACVGCDLARADGAADRPEPGRAVK